MKIDEKIWFSYLPKPKIMTIIALSILTITGLISLFNAAIFMNDLPFEDFFSGVAIILGLLMFGMIFVMGVFITSLFTHQANLRKMFLLLKILS